ncbi:quinone oxidoreductase family protein [Microbacterium amylolyticum]|uniref:Enoyl reductase n=1 Tax=Microbacterium amylolyticum TaxID=936337 RepID=A0ABS4ZK16_9MICO|nr:NADP-dependent oxidoreductase [Microbacterium amylolyticum]MBP2437630.1 enoyl reductase [Microbacterium amylolyticum]
MAKAVQYTQLGGPEVLTVNEIPEQQPGPGKIAVRIEAAGVNPIDQKLREGIRAAPPFTSPRGTGLDGAGTVTAVGDDVDGFRAGDPVAFTGTLGTYATDIVISASKAAVRPAGVSAAQGAALGIPAGTAYQALKSLGVREDDTLLIHGGSGSVGQAAIQFGVLFGARVIATTSDARADRVSNLGAEPVRYGDGLTGRVLEMAPDGVTAILDCAGADGVLEASVELLDDSSRIATIVLGAQADEMGLRAFAGGSATPLTEQQNAWRSEALPVSLALIAAGYFDVELGDAFPLDRAAEAQEATAKGAAGKLLILPNS